MDTVRYARLLFCSRQLYITLHALDSILKDGIRLIIAVYPNRQTNNVRYLKNVLTSSTSSSVKGPPYLSLPKSSREGADSSPVGQSTAMSGILVLSGIV